MRCSRRARRRTSPGCSAPVMDFQVFDAMRCHYAVHKVVNRAGCALLLRGSGSGQASCAPSTTGGAVAAGAAQSHFAAAQAQTSQNRYPSFCRRCNRLKNCTSNSASCQRYWCDIRMEQLLFEIRHIRSALTNRNVPVLKLEGRVRLFRTFHSASHHRCGCSIRIEHPSSKCRHTYSASATPSGWPSFAGRVDRLPPA